MRRLYIDNIRWMTVVLVVLYHVIYMFNGIETFGVIGPFSGVQYQDTYQYLVYPWFMLLSGALGGKATVPFVILLALVVWGAAQILNTPMIVVYRFGIYGLGFFFGYFIFSHDEMIERLEKCWLLLLVCALALAIAFTVIYWGKPYAEHSVLDTPLCNVFAWITVLAVLAVMKKWGDFSNAFTEWMGKKSWGLYLFHYLFIAMASYYLTMYAKNLSVPMVYLCVAVAGFAGSYLAHAIISHIPVLRWLICGMGGKKKDVCR